MTTLAIDRLPALYGRDETAWLDAMAGLALAGRAGELDLPHLAEYLADMAAKDRREVESRLVVLLAHLLKWDMQPSHRSRSWRATVIEQRQELARLAGRGVLLNHAESSIHECHGQAIERASNETGITKGRFPASCPYILDQLLSVELPEVDR